MAIWLERGGALYTQLAVNMPRNALGEGEFFARTYEENAELRGPLLDTGLFIDTGARVPTGFVVLEVWRLVASPVAPL